MLKIKKVESLIGSISGGHKIKSRLSKARRALKSKKLDRRKALSFLDKAIIVLDGEVSWRLKASENFLNSLKVYEKVISGSIGLRSQEKLTSDQAKEIASCQAHHRDCLLYTSPSPRD